MNAGVPKGSTLSRLLFLICVNDLSDNLHHNDKLISDDTSLFSAGDKKNKANNFNKLGKKTKRLSSRKLIST